MIYLTVFVFVSLGFAVYFTYGIRNSKEGQHNDGIRKFLMKYSPSSDDASPLSSSTTSDDELLSSMLITTDEERSPSDKRQKKQARAKRPHVSSKKH